MNKIKNDIFLVVAVTILMATGLIMVFSASAFIAQEKFGTILYFSYKQILWGFLCFLAIFGFSRINYTNFSKNNIPHINIIISFVLLIGLFFLGEKVNGAQRWYRISFASFQPSELAKIATIIYFAYIFSEKSEKLRDWKKGLLPHVISFLLIFIPIMLQPDLSSALMIAIIIGVMALLSNIRFKHMLAGFLFIIPGIYLKMQSSDYQVLRLKQWWENLFNPLGSGHQIKQSLIGLGRGGFIGEGPGSSVQKFYFLPDSHTDFVFAILGEEIGLIGTTAVLLLFMLILWRGIAIAKNAPNPFGQFLAVGLTMNLVLYAVINAGVVTMLLPATGLPMPFLSYGGTSLLFVGVAVGILMNISRNSKKKSLSDRVNQYQQNRNELSQTLIMSR